MKAPTGISVWLARDHVATDGIGSYILSLTQMRELAGGWQDKDGDVFLAIPPSEWHRMGGIRLKPGDGQVRVRITLDVRPIGRTAK